MKFSIVLFQFSKITKRGGLWWIPAVSKSLKVFAILTNSVSTIWQHGFHFHLTMATKLPHLINYIYMHSITILIYMCNHSNIAIL